MNFLSDFLKEGDDAFHRGLTKSNNPYMHGTSAYWIWLEGWERAFKIKEDREDNNGGWL